MPMVIPLVAAYAAGSAAVAAVAAGTLTTLGTIAAYATIAGSVLTGVGALSGSKDLMKIGAVLSIGGGLGSLASGAAATAEEAAAADGAMAGSGGAQGAMESTGSAADSASGAAAPEVAGAPEVASPLDPNAALPSPVNPGGPVQTTPLAGDALQVTAPTTAAIDPVTGVATGATDAAQAAGTPLMDKAGILGSQSVQAPDPSAINPGVANPSAPVAPNAVQQAGSKMTSSDLSSWFEKAKSAGGAVADFMQKNPALVKIGGEALASMYGPAAEKFDYEKSLMDRARANLNAPVQMRYMKPGA